MKKSQLKTIIMECLQGITEAKLPPHLQALVKKIESLPKKDQEKLMGGLKGHKFVDRTPKGYGPNEGCDEDDDEELEEDRDYRREYDNYQGKPDQKKNRAMRNRARRHAEANGRVSKGDGKDVDHKNPLRSGGSKEDHNIRVRDRSANRSDNGQG